MNTRIIIYVVGIVVCALVIYGVSAGVFNKNATQSSYATSTSMSVVGTFYPLAHFAEQVGGENVTVTTITPPGVEPHDYEPTPQDVIKMYDANVVLINGGGVDAWAEKIKSDLRAKGVHVIDMQERIQLMDAPEGSETTHDPHIWLDPVLVQQQVYVLRDAFVAADPAHTKEYNANAATYIAQLQELDNRYKTVLSSCVLKDIVTSHAAFGYLATRYNLNQISLTGLSPDAEPSAQELARIAQIARQKKIKYIFFETLVSPKLSQTIATEIGAQTIAFNPLEGLTEEEIKEGKTYISEMENNLAHLKIALQCAQ